MIAMMMRLTQRQAGRRIEGDGGLSCLIVLGVCLFLGLLFGLLFASLGQVSTELSDYLQSYFAYAGDGGPWRPAIWSVIWELSRWPLAALVFGFTTLGVFCVPALLLARGFLLSYSVCIFIRIFGFEGFLAALTVFGVMALLGLPVLLAVSCQAFRSALERLGGAERGVVSLHQNLAVLGPAAGLLAVGTVLQWAVMPSLLQVVCTRFFVG